MKLHDDALGVTPERVRAALDRAAPASWRTLTLRPGGHGTDNVMLRLGDELVVRVPQRVTGSVAIEKETRWLPRLADAGLPVAVPAPCLVVPPTDLLPVCWAVYGWIEGDVPSPADVSDWSRFGRDLAGFVRALHALDVSREAHGDDMTWYRGRPLADFDDDALEVVDEIEHLVQGGEVELDIPRLRRVWADLSSTPQASRPHVLLHGDLRAANLLVRDGVLAAVIDFGVLSVGLPDAEHGPIWSFPLAARQAYRSELELTDDEWRISLGWSLLPALTGLPYYRQTWPQFARDCLERIRLVMTEVERL